MKKIISIFTITCLLLATFVPFVSAASNDVEIISVTYTSTDDEFVLTVKGKTASAMNVSLIVKNQNGVLRAIEQTKTDVDGTFVYDIGVVITEDKGLVTDPEQPLVYTLYARTRNYKNEPDGYDVPLYSNEAKQIYCNRFNNADSYYDTGTGFLGYNMFAYCNNNPITNYDPEGTGILTIIAVIVIGGGTLLLTGCSEEKRNWPKDCPYSYWNEGGGEYNANCYGYVFDYYGWVIPGWFCKDTLPIEAQGYNYRPNRSTVVYTRELMIQCVEGDAKKQMRTVEHINSPDDLPNGALLVACKISSDGKDFHFAVCLPNKEWLDKPGAGESRYNKIDGLAESWTIAGKTYDSDTIYFAYFRRE